MDVHEAINLAINEATNAERYLNKNKSLQVRSKEEKEYLAAISYSWKKHASEITSAIPQLNLSEIDVQYSSILECTAKNAARATYISAIKIAKNALIKLRSGVYTSKPVQNSTQTDDEVPDFTPLASDKEMRNILIRRWDECKKCMRVEASLAATVMMGGLLEALFLAKANKMIDKSPLFKAKSAPKDPKTKQTLALKDWTLGPYIDVGHELKWIAKSSKDVAIVLRDYRNYIHPEKERTHGIILTPEDCKMFWEITKILARQLLNSP